MPRYGAHTMVALPPSYFLNAAATFRNAFR
ncbi:hypothetical protein J2X98_000385 [Pseudarthrobacter enclensis]|uniref:Uncharacterized protein n=2 Tax=Pseudarthrobacter TaxID=1742993 RepID=A0ABT9RNK0_9MICC|nr:hypothetical protein [Pseudarthrobacter enclensis]